MSLSDSMASIGVAILLIAFLLNLYKILSTDSKLYSLLNIVGAGLCGISAYLISFYPFVILESVWAFVAIFSLCKRVPRETCS